MPSLYYHIPTKRFNDLNINFPGGSLTFRRNLNSDIRLRVISFMARKFQSKFEHPSINLGDARNDFIFEFQERLPSLLKFAWKMYADDWLGIYGNKNFCVRAIAFYLHWAYKVRRRFEGDHNLEQWKIS